MKTLVRRNPSSARCSDFAGKRGCCKFWGSSAAVAAGGFMGCSPEILAGWAKGRLFSFIAIKLKLAVDRQVKTVGYQGA